MELRRDITRTKAAEAGANEQLLKYFQLNGIRGKQIGPSVYRREAF